MTEEPSGWCRRPRPSGMKTFLKPTAALSMKTGKKSRMMLF